MQSTPLGHEDRRRAATELSNALQELHRALIRAEIGDDPNLDNPYTQLFALIGDPRFSWMGVLSQLIVRIDEAVSDRELDADGLAEGLEAWRSEAGALIGQTGADTVAQFRLRHLIAVQQEPAVGLATGRLRKVLAAISPPADDQ